MHFSKLWIITLLAIGFSFNLHLPDAKANHPQEKNRHQHFDDSQSEIVWKSDRFLTSWFGQTVKARLGNEGVLADRVAVKAGRHTNLEVTRITVTYLDRDHRRPQKLHFYPHERIQNGDRVQFKLRGVRRVIGVKVASSGWSGSRSRDGFRIVLKKGIRRPPPGWVQTGYYYGQCIGGHLCPGYRRNPIKRFSIDLEDEMNIQRIQFFAHDRIGPSNNAKINIYVDDRLVAPNMDIKRKGSEQAFNLKNIYGRYITFEAATNDEAVIQRISVDYSAYWDRSRRGRDHQRHRDRQRHQNQNRIEEQNRERDRHRPWEPRRDHRNHRRFSP